MHRRFVLGLAAVSLAVGSSAQAQSQNAEAEVLGVVRILLNAIETKDAAPVKAHVDSTTRFTLTRPDPAGGSRVLVIPGDQFLEILTRPGGPPAKELIRNPEVRIDGDLATVWTEYQFLVNNAVDHCGYDAFHLARTSNGWRVINVSDSFRKDGCGSQWPAP